MSWMSELYQVYENNCGKGDEKTVLLPVAHSTANAQIEVTLSEEGAFITASKIEDKTEAETIIPVTEDSCARSSGNTPHPFADKLLYIAGDYKYYATGKRADNTEYYRAYMEQLKKWCDSVYVHPAVKAVYAYLEKKCLIKDLVACRVFAVEEESGRLSTAEKIQGIGAEDSFVRFRIEYRDLLNTESRTWRDSSLYESYIKFNADMLSMKQLCYATGEVVPCTYKHPSKIRNAGDKAKMISSNDESGFTYRGRFENKEQAFSIGYDFSQKMHNALKWLVKKQGISIDSMTLVVWESNLQPLPGIMDRLEGEQVEASEDMSEDESISDEDWEDFDEEDKNLEGSVYVSDTMPAYRERVRKAVWGKGSRDEIASRLSPKSKAMLMILDAATTGRLSMTMYTEMPLSEFYKNVENWHVDTGWLRYNPNTKKREISSFSLYEIAEYAFGTEKEEKGKRRVDCGMEIKKDVILRLIPCVAEGRNIPKDIVNQLVNKASRPSSYKNRSNWIRVLEAACGMMRKTMREDAERKNIKEEENVALKEDSRDRSYLYGRLLAIADAAEASTYTREEERATNVNRLFETFANRPYQTWEIIRLRLQPYLNRMEAGRRAYFEGMLRAVTDMFEGNDYENNSKLSPVYLQAYYCQLNKIYTKNNNNSKEENR